MKDKCISAQSGSLLSYFQEKDQDRFHNQEAFTALPHSKEGAVREFLSDMTRRALPLRLRKRTYQIIPYEQDAATYLPDWPFLLFRVELTVDSFSQRFYIISSIFPLQDGHGENTFNNQL